MQLWILLNLLKYQIIRLQKYSDEASFKLNLRENAFKIYVCIFRNLYKIQCKNSENNVTNSKIENLIICLENKKSLSVPPPKKKKQSTFAPLWLITSLRVESASLKPVFQAIYENPLNNPINLGETIFIVQQNKINNENFTTL